MVEEERGAEPVEWVRLRWVEEVQSYDEVCLSFPSPMAMIGATRQRTSGGSFGALFLTLMPMLNSHSHGR